MARSFKNFEMRFGDALIAAVILHIIVMSLLGLKIKLEEVQLPFKVINIKIGNPFAVSMPGPSENVANNQKTDVITKKIKTEITVTSEMPTKKPNIPEKSEKLKDKVKRNENISKKKAEINLIPKIKNGSIPIIKPIVIANKAVNSGVSSNSKVKGSELGNNPVAGQEEITSYGQLLSLWIDKHKNYPEEARKRKIEGYAVIKLEIRRDGNIVAYDFVKRTGNEILDKATKEIIEKSSPVPPIPEGYSGGYVIPFVIAIRFVLEKAS